jgi:hypothetical protein
MARSAFCTVSSIKVEDPATWSGKVILTFDLDWAPDYCIVPLINLVERYDICATWFVTHDTPLLARLRENPRFETGIHPNFVPTLLEGRNELGPNAQAVLDHCLRIVPEAVSVRAHSLVQCGHLYAIYKQRGITHDVDCFLPAFESRTLKPWSHWSDIVMVPYNWEDDFWFSQAIRQDRLPSRAEGGILGLDFHPIHIYLNTDRPERYVGARPHVNDKPELDRHRFDGVGAATMLQSLLNQIS